MIINRPSQGLISGVLIFVCCSSLSVPGFAEYSQLVDQRSYYLGIVGAFSELVHLGVKKLALSEVLPSEEMDLFYADARVVTDRNELQLYPETDLLLSDLYPADIAARLHVLLICTEDTLDKHLALEAAKARLVNSGLYTGAARRDIAVRFGQLLSYPKPVIEKLIWENGVGIENHSEILLRPHYYIVRKINYDYPTSIYPTPTNMPCCPFTTRSH